MAEDCKNLEEFKYWISETSCNYSYNYWHHKCKIDMSDIKCNLISFQISILPASSESLWVIYIKSPGRIRVCIDKNFFINLMSNNLQVKTLEWFKIYQLWIRSGDLFFLKIWNQCWRSWNIAWFVCYNIATQSSQNSCGVLS